MAEIQHSPGVVLVRLGFLKRLLRSLVLGPDSLPLGDDGSDSQRTNQQDGSQSTEGKRFPPASCSLQSVDYGKGLWISHWLPGHLDGRDV
jgi:hypothetical protein